MKYSVLWALHSASLKSRMNGGRYSPKPPSKRMMSGFQRDILITLITSILNIPLDDVLAQ